MILLLFHNFYSVAYKKATFYTICANFSCKLTSEDKKMFGRQTIKRGVSPHELAALSPPTTCSVSPPTRARTWSTRWCPRHKLRNLTEKFFLSSTEGGMVGACSRKTLFYLISTLNHSYGADYDFTSAQSDEFSHEPSTAWVKNFIDSTLTAAAHSTYTPLVKAQVKLFINVDTTYLKLKSLNDYFFIFFS